MPGEGLHAPKETVAEDGAVTFSWTVTEAIGQDSKGVGFFIVTHDGHELAGVDPYDLPSVFRFKCDEGAEDVSEVDDKDDPVKENKLPPTKPVTKPKLPATGANTNALAITSALLLGGGRDTLRAPTHHWLAR